MREPFRSLRTERRKTVPKPNKWKFNVSRSDVVAGIGLLISIGALVLSFAHYKMDESAQDQPFRLAKYQVRMESYKRFNDRIDDWMRLKFEESELDAAVIRLAGLPAYDNLLTINMSRRAVALSNHTLAFYKAQVIERTYWPDARTMFTQFDKNITRTIDCSAYLAKVAVDLEQHEIAQSQVGNVVSQLDAECHIRANATKSDIEPYQSVIGELGRLMDKQSPPIAR
jgi:hypothetical protein